MSEPLHAYVGRQAVFDRNLKVVAYELLYRDSEENRARIDDPDQATATTMLNAVVELGLDKLVGELPIFVNLPAAFLLKRYPVPLPPERTYLEVLEDVPVTPELIDAIKGFRAEGFKIALDDFLLTDQTRPLVPLADLIKVDVLGVPRDDIDEQFDELRPLCKTLLAEKISTHDEMAHYHLIGFDLFQGHFLQMPIVERGRRLPHNRAALVQVLAKLYQPNIDLRAVEAMLSAEVGLSVRLLKLASSAALSRGAPIANLGQAIARLGTQQIAALVLLVLVAGFDDKPFELARQALIRARMCEALARTTNVPPDQLFTAGLLSLLDALLDRPLDEIVDDIPVTPLIRGALVGGTGSAAKIVDAARAQDHGDFARVASTGFTAQKVFVAWYEAIRWADEIIAQL
ncbi:MAG: HDOD domain-containing protein [Deltaproteobacteria bacterium]|nr:HDOD domain-containing protein [Deltaproteobacteria bacterium]